METLRFESDTPLSSFGFQVGSEVNRADSAEDPVDQIRLNKLLKALNSSMGIASHSDFSQWLQNDICDYLSHDTLLSAWGNFQTGELDYDVASTNSNLSTRDIYNNPGVGSLLNTLHNRAQQDKNGWYILNENSELEAFASAVSNFSFLKSINVKMKSVLVCIIPGDHKTADRLYIFCNKKNHINIDSSTLGFLMPHIDTALRQITNP